MRKTLIRFISAVLVLFFKGACAVPIYNSVSAGIPPGSSVKVIPVNPNNPIYATVEQSVLQAGFPVISDNTIVADINSANIRYESRDTTIYRNERMPVFRALFEDKGADYLLRYSYTGSPGTMLSFSASLIDPQSGAVVGTVSYECESSFCGGKTVVLRQLMVKLFT